MTTINESTRLQAARAAVDEASARLTDINRQMAELAAAAQRKRDQAAAVMAPKQEKRGILARILKRGGMPEPAETTELKALDKRIAQAAADADTATTEAEVIGEMLAELQAEADTIHATARPRHRELAEAQFEAAAAEIQNQALPESLRATEAWMQAYGKLLGLGQAHSEIGSKFSGQHGTMPGTVCGTANPAHTPSIWLAGFPVEQAVKGHPTLQARQRSMLLLPMGELIKTTAADAVNRWQKL